MSISTCWTETEEFIEIFVQRFSPE